MESLNQSLGLPPTMSVGMAGNPPGVALTAHGLSSFTPSSLSAVQALPGAAVTIPTALPGLSAHHPQFAAMGVRPMMSTPQPALMGAPGMAAALHPGQQAELMGLQGPWLDAQKRALVDSAQLQAG